MANRWSRALDRVRARAGGVVDLTESNPTRVGLDYPRDAILKAFGAPENLSYDPVALGLDEARQAGARCFAERGSVVPPERIAVTASTSEAYALLLKLLCDAGDDVLVGEPSYPLVEHLTRYESVGLAPYRLAYDGAWHIDVDSVRRAMGPRTRAILLVSPNNPTGSFVKDDEFEALGELGLPIISDEVFGAYGFGDEARTSSLRTEGPLVFALDGLSKRALLPQMKLAWIAVGGEPALTRAAIRRLEIIADAYLSASTPSQRAAPAWLEATRDLTRAVLARARANYRVLLGRLRPTGATPLHVEGGWCAPVRLPAVLAEDEWIDHFVEAGVLVQPGWLYDFAEGPIVVVSLIVEEAVLIAGLNRLVRVVETAG